MNEEKEGLFQLIREKEELQIFVIVPDKLILIQNLYDRETSDLIYRNLLEETPWEQKYIQIHGNRVPVPRLTAWYGSGSYKYSGIVNNPNLWRSSLLNIKSVVQFECFKLLKKNVKFNSLLLNYYRNGKDSVAPHRDDEPELGINPTIASLSFGAKRKFKITELKTKKSTLITLHPGSLLVMYNDFQELYEHSLIKDKTISKGRVNLTFRYIKL